MSAARALCEAAGFDTERFILKSFNYYKNNRNNNDNAFGFEKLVDQLIYVYYELNYKEIHFNNMKQSFVEKYVTNETSLEGINYLTKHGREELIGLAKMYEYMHSDNIEDRFDIFSIKDLHEKLFSCTPHPEFGGNFRREFARLSDSKVNICDWSEIYYRLRDLDQEVCDLRELAPEIKDLRDPKLLLMYLDRCVELNCKLIKVHPFADGNGRTVRCFINKLMEDAGLPSVYIKVEERDEYLKCMDKAMEKEDYSDIKQFYRYKVCDSIVELDIIERLKHAEDTNGTGIKTGHRKNR